MQIDPENTQFYENNVNRFITQADELKNNYQSTVSTQDFIIFHEAFNYLFNEFNISDKNVLVLEETAGREPSV
ncbi:MAG: metal ABC transporter solute-binding protein, Zn/Mn family [Patescibacteria group bacterium]